MLINKREGFNKANGVNITFSFTSQFLNANNYISDDIYNLIYNLRKIRNIYSHNAIIQNEDVASIKSRKKTITDILANRWVTSNYNDLKTMKEENAFYYILIENLTYSLIALNFWIIPNYHLATVQFIQAETQIKVTTHVGNFNEYLFSLFSQKFN